MKINELDTRAELLREELSEQQGLKHQLKTLLKNLDSQAMQAIERRGYADKTPKKTSLLPEIDYSKTSKVEVMRIAWAYDAETYFRYSPGRKSMKLRYRALGKAYRVSRLTAVKSARSGRSLVRRRR